MAVNDLGLPGINFANTLISDGEHPLVLDGDLRGTLQYITGDDSDQLLDILGSRLQEGMLVYIKRTYDELDGTTRTAETYYQYKLQSGDSEARVEAAGGTLPNAIGNWIALRITDSDSHATIANVHGHFTDSEGDIRIALESDSEIVLYIRPGSIESEHIESDFLARILSDVLPSDSSIIALIEGDSDLDLFDNIITGDQIAPQSIESEHIQVNLLQRMLSDVLPGKTTIDGYISEYVDSDYNEN